MLCSHSVLDAHSKKTRQCKNPGTWLMDKKKINEALKKLPALDDYEGQLLLAVNEKIQYSACHIHSKTANLPYPLLEAYNKLKQAKRISIATKPETTKPAEATKPTVATKPTEATKPTVATKLTVATKPTEATKPTMAAPTSAEVEELAELVEALAKKLGIP